MPVSSIGGYVQDGVKTPNVTVNTVTYVGAGSTIIGQPLFYEADSVQDVTIAATANMNRFAGIATQVVSQGSDLYVACADGGTGECTVNLFAGQDAGTLAYAFDGGTSLKSTAPAGCTTNCIIRVLTTIADAGVTNGTILTESVTTA